MALALNILDNQNVPIQKEKKFLKNKAKKKINWALKVIIYISHKVIKIKEKHEKK